MIFENKICKICQNFTDFFLPRDGLKMNSEKTKHQPVMLGREKDFVCFYLEAQSGKIEKRETWEQWAPGAQDIHDKQTKIGTLTDLTKNLAKIGRIFFSFKSFKRKK